MSRTLTREQLLAWRENWSFTDKELITHSLDVLGETDYYEPASNGYVCVRVSGRVALEIAPGVLYWTSPKWTERLDLRMFPGGLGGGDEDKGRWYHLSTYMKPGPSGPSIEEEMNAPCPFCFLVPTVTGACGCD